MFTSFSSTPIAASFSTSCIEDRKDRRVKANQSDRRRVVIALRESAGRTLTFVRNREAEGVDIARARMLAGSKLFADEASHWDVLEGEFASTASTTRKATATATASIPTWWKAISAAFAPWLLVSTTTCHTATSTSTPIMPHGWKIIVAGQMAATPLPCLVARSIIRCRAFGKAIGSGPNSPC